MARFYQLFTTVVMTVVATVNSLTLSEHIPRFISWMSTHSIVPESLEHEETMFNNWVANDEFINAVNNLNLTYTLAHNAFSGMSYPEFQDYMRFHNNAKEIENMRFMDKNYAEEFYEAAALPTAVDWRTQGVVTPVKDQGQCGSCYSFSTTGSLEGAYSLKYGSLQSFSEQQVVDCSRLATGGPNMGCNGGQISASLQWVGKVGGLCTESGYPYVSGTTKTYGTCQQTCTRVSGSKVVSVTNVPQNSDVAMMTALVKQPVSVAVEADQPVFQFYSSGVFTQSCGTNLDHAVLLVGYGTMNGNDYYIMKNSWGATWGSQGYMYLGRGAQYNGGSGQCGVLMEGSYPNL